MKTQRILLMFVLFGVLFSGRILFAAALDNWHWRNPLPNGNPQTGPHTLHGMVFANGQFIAVGDNGMASISPDGTNWTESATATTTSLNAIAFISGLFVAVGENGVVESSNDGANWVLGTSGITNSLLSAAYGNGRFAAVGVNGAIIASTNAVNWFTCTSGTSNTLVGVTYGSVGFMAVCPNSQTSSSTSSGGTDQYFSSMDGIIWTSHTLTVGNLYTNNAGFALFMHHDIVTFADGLYMIGSWRYPGSGIIRPYIFTSPDGSSWTTNSFPDVNGAQQFSHKFFSLGTGTPFAIGQTGFGLSGQVFRYAYDGLAWTYNLPSGIEITGPTFLYSGASGNGVSVMVGSTSFSYSLPPIFTSVDGTNWVNQQHVPTPPTGPTSTFTSITFSNGTYVVAASNSIVQSANGLVYTNVNNSPSLTSVIASTNDFVGIGSGGKIYLSGDGISWTQRNSGTANNLHGIASGGGLLVAVGDNGTIQTSSTGTIWTSRTSGTSLPLYGVAYSNGLHVAVGQLGTVLTSLDGISWTGQDSGQLTNLLSVAYGSAGFAAVGPGGTILTSMDGANWTKQNPGMVATLESISFGNGYYLITGDGAVVLTSPDGATWTSRNDGATGGQNLYGSAFLNNRFDVVGSAGTIIESDPVPPLFDVQIHHGGRWLTAFAPPGSSFRIQTCTNLALPIWVDAASFNNASALTQWTNNAASINQLFYRAILP
jgi:hypothetical protein